MVTRQTIRVLGAVAVLLIACSSGRGQTPVGVKRSEVLSLALFPKTVILTGPYQDARVIVSSIVGEKKGDVTARVSWSVADPQVAVVDSDGFVRPVSNGRTLLTAEWNGTKATAGIQVSGIRRTAPS